MKKNMNYNETVEYILSIPKFAVKSGIDNLKVILDSLGNPQDSKKSIHIAGTNGKGSTATYIANILMESGYKVGVFTSPHLIKINERLKINNKDITDEEFTSVFSDLKGYIDVLLKRAILHPSYFELLFIMATLWFEKSEVDYVVYETGLGGRLDATNIINPEISVITSVSYDHMQYLGDTLEDIAKEKAGIIKRCTPIVYFNRQDEVGKIIEKIANEKNAGKYFIDNGGYTILGHNNKMIDFSINNGYYEYDNISMKKTAMYQVENAILAITAVNIMLKRCLEEDVIKKALLNVIWEARMEEVLPDVFLDGAHNEEAISSFCNTVNTLYNDKAINIIFAVAEDKDYKKMIRNLCNELSIRNMYITNIDNERALDTKIIGELFAKSDIKKTTIVRDLIKEFDDIVYEKSEDERIFAVGSLYLAGKIKTILNKRTNND